MHLKSRNIKSTPRELYSTKKCLTFIPINQINVHLFITLVIQNPFYFRRSVECVCVCVCDFLLKCTSQGVKNFVNCIPTPSPTAHCHCHCQCDLTFLQFDKNQHQRKMRFHLHDDFYSPPSLPYPSTEFKYLKDLPKFIQL